MFVVIELEQKLFWKVIDNKNKVIDNKNKVIDKQI